uniref:Ig-like domain-containing protein n=1 Tax=Leptobrachium leishanense TaxID=445787 RepID=A0A8C5M459_9ANUR
HMKELTFLFHHPQDASVEGQDSVSHQDKSLSADEGESITITCSYKVSAFRGLKWFIQKPEDKPVELATLFSGTSNVGKIVIKLLQDSKSSLYIPSTSVSDSASYICAVEAQCEERSITQYNN